MIMPFNCTDTVPPTALNTPTLAITGSQHKCARAAEAALSNALMSRQTDAHTLSQVYNPWTTSLPTPPKTAASMAPPVYVCDKLVCQTVQVENDTVTLNDTHLTTKHWYQTDTNPNSWLVSHCFFHRIQMQTLCVWPSPRCKHD